MTWIFNANMFGEMKDKQQNSRSTSCWIYFKMKEHFMSFPSTIPHTTRFDEHDLIQNSCEKHFINFYSVQWLPFNGKKRNTNFPSHSQATLCLHSSGDVSMAIHRIDQTEKEIFTLAGNMWMLVGKMNDKSYFATTTYKYAKTSHVVPLNI